MEESLYEFVMRELQEAKGTWPAVSRATKISKRTIEKIASKESGNPGIQHIESLARYFKSANHSGRPVQKSA